MRYFLSYARKDKDFAAKLVNDLTKYDQLEVWWDTRINPASEWDQTLQEEISRADILLVVLSPNSVASENVLNEIVYAKKTKKRIIPLLAFKCEIPLNIIRVQWVDFTRSYTAGLDDLLKTLLGGEAKKKYNAEALKSARAKARKMRIRAFIFVGLLSGILLLAGRFFWVDHPLEGAAIINEAGYKVSYEISNGNMVFHIKSSDIPSLAVDVNGNGKIDSGVDRSYGIAGYDNGELCPSYFRSQFGLTTCHGAPSMASLQTSGSRYSFTIPLDELRSDSTSGVIRVQFSFFDVGRGITRLFPVRTEPADFSKMFIIKTGKG
jgi:TIR domain